MVRLGGLNYVCDPNAAMGHRIRDLTLTNGTQLEAEKHYKVAGWATVGTRSEGPPIFDVVADYLRHTKTVRVDKLTTPRLVNIGDNPGVEGYPHGA